MIQSVRLTTGDKNVAFILVLSGAPFSGARFQKSFCLQAKADAKEEFIQAKKNEQEGLRAMRAVEARQREESQRQRFEQKVNPHRRILHCL